jgi:undecaprenyl-diphosphatase
MLEEVSDINQQLFLFIYHVLGPTSFLSSVTIFFAEWFPFLVVLCAFVYELYLRTNINLLQSTLRIYLPPLTVLFFTEIFKLFFPSARPFAALDIMPLISVHDPFGSFPSSHAAFFASLGVTMYMYDKKVGKWFLVSAVIIAIARVGAGVHWPGDILWGLSIGLLVGYLVEKILLWTQTLRPHR